MATITKPSSPGWKSVRAVFAKAKARSESPFTLQSQTYLHQGSKWVFTLTLPSMSTTQASAWLTFLYNLTNNDDTFSCNMSAYVPSGVTGTMTLRAVGNETSWDVDDIKRFGVSFTVETAQ